MKGGLLFALIVCLFLLAACSNSPTAGLTPVDESSKQIASAPEKTAQPEEVPEPAAPVQEEAEVPATQTAQTANATDLSKYEDKYAVLQAEISCSLLGVTDLGEIQRINGLIPSLSEKYGFSSETLVALKAKYKDDAAFKALVKQRMYDVCPLQANYYMKK